jgi:hypothetical protein
MAKQRSTRQWAALLDSYRGSGLSQVEFCRRRGLALSTFGYHLRRVRGGDVKKGSSPGLVEVSLGARCEGTIAPADDRVEIEIDAAPGQRVRIRCHRQHAGDILRQIPGLRWS